MLEKLSGGDMDKLIEAIQCELWEKALELFVEYSNVSKLDDQLCILGATILEHFNDREGLFEIIQTGLKFNPYNYELYLLLGKYYALENSDKAFLSYENALYYSEKSGNESDTAEIELIISNYIETVEVKTKEVSIMVLCDDCEYSELCINSIINTCYEGCYEIHRVDVSDFTNRVEAINIAVANSDNNKDVFLLSGDAVLTPNALYYLRMALYDNEKVGMVSAVSNNALYYQRPSRHGVKTAEDAMRLAMTMNIPDQNSLEEKTIVDSNYVIIRRELADKVFPLEKNIVSDKYLAINLCLDANQRGYQNIICWNSFVYHFERASCTARNEEYKIPDRVRVKEKWGFSAEYYMTTRKELADMINREKSEDISVLEVGAGLGSTLTYIKRKFPNSRVRGIEIVDTVVRFAAKNIEMKCDNIETYAFEEGEKYDYVIFGDVLEHLVDPYSIVEKLRSHLNPGGCIIASIPNILNAGAIYEILHGGFEYKSSGILDSTHLRFFTQKEILRLFQTRGYEIIDMFGILGAENSHAFGDFFDKLTSIDGVVDRSEFDVLQYAVCARVISD